MPASCALLYDGTTPTHHHPSTTIYVPICLCSSAPPLCLCLSSSCVCKPTLRYPSFYCIATTTPSPQSLLPTTLAASLHSSLIIPSPHRTHPPTHVPPPIPISPHVYTYVAPTLATLSAPLHTRATATSRPAPTRLAALWRSPYTYLAASTARYRCFHSGLAPDRTPSHPTLARLLLPTPVYPLNPNTPL